jgi:predicted hydrocarbon binding protein
MSPTVWGTRGVLSGWAVDEALCVELTGYLRRFLAFTGGKQVSVEHVECCARRGEHCVFEFRYR